jgi:hypothetical protein
MKFYKYWAAAEALVPDGRRPWKLRAYGGSNDGMSDAARRARETAERAAAAIGRGNWPDTYGYADRPLREEIVEEIDQGDRRSAVITRNAYGALVLNTTGVMFVDVDYFPPNASDSGFGQSLGDSVRHLWNRLRGRPSSVNIARDERLLSRFEQVVHSRPGFGARVYRTAGGFRLLVTSKTFDPSAIDSEQLLADFGSDPLYIRLCKSQECFRARLTAKFWRCGATKPPSRYPWDDPREEARYRQWEAAYQRQSSQFATCEFVQSIGDPMLHDAVAPVMGIHDRHALRDGARLA